MSFSTIAVKLRNTKN